MISPVTPKSETVTVLDLWRQRIPHAGGTGAPSRPGTLRNRPRAGCPAGQVFPMSQWPLIPSLVLSSRANRFLPISALAVVAHEAGTDGLDLDLTARSGATMFGFGSGARVKVVPGAPIPSLWLPGTRRPGLTGARADRFVADWLGLTERLGVRQLLVEREAALRPLGDHDKRPLLLRLQDGVGPRTRITLVLRPRDLEGNRAHLAAMASLRRTAEEWDFDLALDLCGPVDPRWEAEAAIQRILPRLTLVRLGTIGGDVSADNRARLTRRSLAYLLDQSYAGTLSLVPAVPWTSVLSATTLGRRTRSEAQAIAVRHQRIFSSVRSSDRLPTRQQR